VTALRDEALAPPAVPAAATAPSALTGARAGLWTLLAAHLVTVWGTQWHIRWHLLIGRDSFWIPPHLMTYSGVTAIVLVSFGVLAWTAQAPRSRRGTERTIRLVGITGARGYLLAAWGIASPSSWRPSTTFGTGRSGST
jgi:hypothetical protein